MTSETALFWGLTINTIGLAIVLIKLLWGGSASYTQQFAALDKACEQSVLVLRNETTAKMEAMSANLGNVIANIGNRIHDLELKAAEARATAAETYMRRDSYHKATDEFKRDVREAHAELKADMDAGFARLENSIGAVSQSIEANRRTDGARPRV